MMHRKPSVNAVSPDSSGHTHQESTTNVSSSSRASASSASSASSAPSVPFSSPHVWKKLQRMVDTLDDHVVIDRISHDLEQLAPQQLSGRILSAKGLRLEIGGLNSVLTVGDRCLVSARDNQSIQVEIVGFEGKIAVAMPFDSIEGVGAGAKATFVSSTGWIQPHQSWLGRVIDPFGNPIDDKGPITRGSDPIRLKSSPPAAHSRDRVGGKIDTGIKCINTFLTLCKGQRMGIFAGSGVGKSMLLSQIARYSNADVVVIGLVGERGREVREFIEDYLGEQGLARSVVVVASSDQSALTRRDAAYTTSAVAEYFRDQGQNVLCLLDSITRFAMAQREIGLSAGEPPAAKGYTPSVFSELPKVLERSGPGVSGGGSITAIYTVLVEGDDLNEPISDAVRGILDGHIVLSRDIANRGRFPSIDVLMSISRMVPRCLDDRQNALINRARSLLSTYSNMEELVRLGAYRKGADPQVDEAVRLFPALEKFISQGIDESFNAEESFVALAKAINDEHMAQTSNVAVPSSQNSVPANNHPSASTSSLRTTPVAPPANNAGDAAQTLNRQ